MATVKFYHVQRSDFDSRTICFGNEQVRLPFALYDTQLEIINELLDSFVEEKHIVIESATGSGKTACFLIAVEVYLALVDENVQFMILVRTMDQLVQTLNQFRCLSFVASCNYGFIAGRDYLCTDPDIRKCPTDKDNLCRRKLEQGCFLEMSLSRKFSKLEDMTNNLSIENAKVPDVEDLKHFLKKEDACPYFACHKLYARNVSVLICNQKYFGINWDRLFVVMPSTAIPMDFGCGQMVPTLFHHCDGSTAIRVFFLGSGAALWLPLLLALSGDIHPHPGPKRQYYCPCCSKTVNRNSVQCSRCLDWVHFRCSGLHSFNDYSKDFQCFSCAPVPSPTSISTAQPVTSSPIALTVSALRILQFNANGISNKLSELGAFLVQHQIHIAVIQESKLSSKSKDPRISGYTTVRQDRTSKGGGLLFFISESLNYKSISLQQNDLHAETLGISICFNNTELAIVNIYIPPASSCTAGYTPDIRPLLGLQDALLLGDFNAHNPLWFSSYSDTRGAKFAIDIDNSDMAVLNQNTPTRLPSNCNPTSPDISLASSTLVTSIDWSTETCLSSDHLPIIISIFTTSFQLKTSRKTFVNLNKADWDAYRSESEAAFTSLPPPTDVFKGEWIFRKILAKAAAHTIPSGRHRKNIPFLPPEAHQLIKQRDALRASNPSSTRLQQLNSTILNLITGYKRKKWTSFLETFDYKSGASKLWRTLKALDNKPISPPNCAIVCSGKQLSNSKQIANHFNRQFSSVKLHRSDNLNRKCNRKIKRLPLSSPLQFTTFEVAQAIEKANKTKAFGPDDLTIFHLKHLGPLGLQYLTGLFNVSIASCKIPAIWKKSTIIPLLKPGKDYKLSGSYRPISLLCPAIKVLESLILPHLNSHLPLKSHQHGFRPQHSTVSALLNLSQTVASGFNRKKPPSRTIVVALDLSKAFDSISHRILIGKIASTGLQPSVIRWLSNYLHGRKCQTTFRNKASSSRVIRSGVPQGSIISPTLFNFYIADLPEPPPNINLVSYADDITIFTSGNNIPDMENNLTQYLSGLSAHLQTQDLIVSPEKSTVTLFTPDKHQSNYHPQVTLNAAVLPFCKTPKILGVTFDIHFTFSAHCERVNKKASTRNRILKALAGSSWGQHKETILVSYKAISRPVFNYASAIWSPYLSNSNFNRLQTTQNSALRIATGCHLMASSAHLHQECKMLPVKEHCDLLASQFLATAKFQEHHPCNSLVQSSERPRKMKETIFSKYGDLVSQHCNPDSTHKQRLTSIHSFFVNRSKNSLEDNLLLGSKPPDIHESEIELPRSTRCALAQLRSSYCQRLNSYKSRIDSAIVNACPSCDSEPHDVAHLFNCPANPTTLEPIDLWRRPVDAATFLQI